MADGTDAAARLIALAAAQIEAALIDSEAPVSALADHFTEIAGQLRGLLEAIERLPAVGAASEAHATATRVAGSLAWHIDQSVLAFQFYDRMAQRLSHVSEGLAALAGQPGALADPESCGALLARMQGRYSTAEERALSAAILAGMPREEALRAHRERATPGVAGGDIELF